jgi:hypothetical protein
LQITIQRTNMNLPFGLEIQIHIQEILSSQLSESGTFVSFIDHVSEQLWNNS